MLPEEALVPRSPDAGTGFCPKPDCRKVMDDHQWFEDGKALDEPRCPEKVGRALGNSQIG